MGLPELSMGASNHDVAQPSKVNCCIQALPLIEQQDSPAAGQLTTW